ncbi:short-chain dehydrogenase/reductase [Xylariaceae sp. FL0804]|nr:short-chain dehydrogenase/reductase [Xylariaceae sp. FL0804]
MASSYSLDPADLFGVRGLVVVITGGGTGIGLMMAQTLEANGAVVYIIGRRMEALEEAAKTAKHGNILPLQGDVTDKASLLRCAEAVAAASGHVDVLVCNAGAVGPPQQKPVPGTPLAEVRRRMLALDEDQFTRTFAVNATAPFYTVAAFLELLDCGNRARGARGLKQTSQVIGVGSIAGLYRLPLAGHAWTEKLMPSVDGASKAALNNLMKGFSTVLIPYDIRTNIIIPGQYPSEMTRDIIAARGDAVIDRKHTPAQRSGDIEDMAGTILYLCSRAGAFCNGNMVVTDGGRLCVVPSSY